MPFLFHMPCLLAYRLCFLISWKSRFRTKSGRTSLTLANPYIKQHVYTLLKYTPLLSVWPSSLNFDSWYQWCFTFSRSGRDRKFRGRVSCCPIPYFKDVNTENTHLTKMSFCDVYYPFWPYLNIHSWHSKH